MMCIYKIENIITNDFYIGSALNYEKRKAAHISRLKSKTHHSPILQNSWNKYGSEVFIFSVVEEIFEKEKLIEREQFYIDDSSPKFNCCQIAGSALGYKHSTQSRLNMSKSHMGKKLSPESIVKRSLKQSGVNHPFYNKKRTDNDVAKMKEGHKKFFENGGIGHRTGKTSSEESKKKMSESHMIPIIQYEKTGEFVREWKGSTEAANELKICSVNINQCCNGRLKTSGGYIWTFLEKSPNTNLTDKRTLPVMCEQDGKIIEYESAKKASEILGINKTNIYLCCRNKQKTAGGFSWKYKEK
jgi:group I intron endonuclease